ncbi:GTPase Era [Trueperella sp. LYQ141]|uniref:GTPase Era n=1 Tax=Trueperella sp. LYQ141 TaxID=3391058 RepID=UPI00398371CC
MNNEVTAEETLDPFAAPEDFRAGFVAIVGRPNAGKSTLTNAAVGTKIAITADQPETTRRAIRGVIQRPGGQVVIIDTPGLHRPRTLLGERLNDMVGEALSDVDAVVMCFPADEKIGPGDRFLLELIAKTRAPIIAAITKTDKVAHSAIGDKIIELTQLATFADIVPVSAVRGVQIDDLVEVLISHMPLSPPLYPRDTVTDESTEERIAELIREAALVGVREELPHSIAVVVDEMLYEEPTEKYPHGRVVVRALLYVERSSQKGIVIGKGGSRLKQVGRSARKNIAQLLGQPVYLDIYVKVAKEWQRDPKLLGRLGF